MFWSLSSSPLEPETNILLCFFSRNFTEYSCASSVCHEVCFSFAVEDIERHDGSTQKPYYMSKELMKILGKKNERPKKNERRNKNK